MRLRIEGGRRLEGRATAPPDKSISHRAVILAGLARGASQVRGVSTSQDVQASALAMQALGVTIERRNTGELHVVGVGGARALRAPSRELDCGNSGTTMRLMAGVIAGAPLAVELTGDASLRRRPMERLRPLEEMGASLVGPRPLHAPMVVRGAELRGVDHALEVASAQVKSALLLAGCAADGETVVREPAPTRDHTERMLRGLGVDCRTEAEGRVHRLTGPVIWSGGALSVPPDPSSAAFLVVAGAVSGGDVWVRSMVHPSRSRVFDMLSRMGFDLQVDADAEMGGAPTAWIRARRARARALALAGADSVACIDEVPVLAAAAAATGAEFTVRDAAELRVKESDRIASTARMLRAFGVDVDERPDGFVQAGQPRGAAVVDAEGDHRIAMSAAVLGLAVPGVSTVVGAECAAVSFPEFDAALFALGARLERET